MAFVIGSIILGVVIRRIKAKDHEDEQKSAVGISPFWIFLIGFFIAAVLMFYPIYYVDYFAAENGATRAFDSFLISVHNTMRMFVLDGEFDIIKDAMADVVSVNVALGYAYQVYAAIMFVIAPVLSAGFVLQFFKSALAFLKYCASVATEVYVFSELNERSIALARDIITGGDDNKSDKDGKRRKRARKLVVFTDVFERNDEHDYELVARAKNLGAVCLKRDITAIGFKQYRMRDMLRKIYLIGDDEDENIQQALTIIEKCRKSKTYNTVKTEVYVFATNSESEILLNSIDNGKVKVRRVNETSNLVLNTLCEHSVFEHANAVYAAKKAAESSSADKSEVAADSNSNDNTGKAEGAPKAKTKGKGKGKSSNVSVNNDIAQAKPSETDEADTVPINIVIIGCGRYGTELAKSLCWLGQMPGYAMTLHIFDKGNARKNLYAVAPELVTTAGQRLDGQPFYDLKFHDDIDVESYEFLEKLTEIDDVTTAFVTLGDDEINIETAIKMRRQFGRANILRGANIPPIFAVVYSMAKSRTVGANGLVNERKANYGITLIGDIKTRYSLENIERKGLEDLGEQYHTQYVKTQHANIEREMKKLIADSKKKHAAGELTDDELDRITTDANEKIEKAEEKISESRDSYNKFEYFRRSSIARAVFYEYRWDLGYAPRDTVPCDDSDKEKARVAANKAFNDMLIDYEHRRWSAYTRSDGYIYSHTRDDLAKTHDKLVATSALSESDRANDAVVRIDHDYEIIKKKKPLTSEG